MSAAVVAVAASGGRDSTALLHATACAASGLGLQVVALHVHHGLMPDADHWQAHLAAQCRRWRRRGLPVSMASRRLRGAPTTGESVEAWARRGRYEALADMARQAGASLVLLAHHRQDQAETFLLQALRGAGPRGLAGMPSSFERDGLRWARPWLDCDRAAIESYLHRHRLGHVDDPSNHEARFARSRLRQQVWPALEAAFPDAAGDLCAAAARAHESDRCLEELGELDARTCVDELGRLLVEPYRRLSGHRQRNLLRFWLRARLGRGAPFTLVTRLSREVLSAQGTARWPAMQGEVVLERGMLGWRAASAPPPAPAGPMPFDLSRPGAHDLPGWGGRIVVSVAAREGVPARWLANCQLRPRIGGEDFQRSPRSIPRSLKKQYQAMGVRGSARSGPLVYAGDQLLFVSGLGMDARGLRNEGDDLLWLQWDPDPASVVRS